jgi:hypothetical protein
MLVILAPGTLLGGERKVKDQPPPEFYSVAFVQVRRSAPAESGTVGGSPALVVAEVRIVENADETGVEDAPPECTPFRTSIDEPMGEVRFEDLNDAWPPFTIHLRAWQKLTKYTEMKDCLASLPKYQGRYTDEQIRDFEKGKITAGMPYEFALMALGVPEGPASYLSVLNPVTERAEECWSYSWLNVGDGVGLAAFFSFLGAGALGFAGNSNNLDDLAKYLRIATIAQIGEAAAWQTVLRRARFVNVQVSSNKKIRAVLVQ